MKSRCDFPTAISTFLCWLVLAGASVSRLGAADLADGYTEHVSALTEHRGQPVQLRGNEKAVTAASFQAPVEILIEAKTNSYNLTTSYGDVEIVLNFDHEPKVGPKGLIVRGKGLRGPREKGEVPVGKYVIIRWAITADHFSFSVDGEERFEHKYDFSTANAPISVSTGGKAEVWVKSIKVRPLTANAK